MCAGNGSSPVQGGGGGNPNPGYSLTGADSSFNKAFNPSGGAGTPQTALQAMNGGGGGINPPVGMNSGISQLPGGAMSRMGGGYMDNTMFGQPSRGAMQNIGQSGGGINPPYGSPFSYAPPNPGMQPRPDWSNGGWNGGGPINPQTPDMSQFNYQPTGNSAPGATYAGGGGRVGIPPPPLFTGNPVTGGDKVPFKSADPNAALYQGIAQGNGGGFTPQQINNAGPGGQGYGDFLKFYQQNQAQLNRQGPMYQPGGIFYGK